MATTHIYNNETEKQGKIKHEEEQLPTKNSVNSLPSTNFKGT